jgi:hypothetical protein
MKPKEPQPPAGSLSHGTGRLSELVDKELNKSLADKIAELREDEQPAPAETDDYARGSSEHDDEPEG